MGGICRIGFISELAGIMRPALRYFGGKWLLAPWIIENFAAHRVYVEPYGGGASVLLRKPRSYAEIYNDLDDEIVSLFRVIRDSGSDLERLLIHTPYSRLEFTCAYESSDCPIESARRTIIKSFMGFGSDAIFRKSGFRSNSNRSGTTPAHDWVNYGDVFHELIERLKGVVIENKNALDVMRTHDSAETLHFVDPPYVSSTRSGGEYRHEMSDADHLEMIECLIDLEGCVVLCGYNSDLYRSAIPLSWSIVSRPALADGARPREEFLWLNEQAAVVKFDLFSASAS